jgi:uncharacterized RDD family membrane protein YckC
MQVIDTLNRVETPDGIELALKPAGPVLRAMAWFVDLVIRAGLLFLFGMLLALLEAVGMAVLLLLWFLINWWYPVLFEVLSRGSTPGKKATGLRVINQDGTPVNWGPSVVRNLLRQIDFLPFFYVTGLISMFCNRRFQRLGDLAAGTLVIYRGNSMLPELKSAEGPIEAPPFVLNADEQRAVLAYAERVTRLHPERAAELANQLSALTGETGTPGVERLLAWARHLQGQRA